MELQHVNIKIFVAGELTVDPARFIDVFHGWIQDQVFDELLIDVADYRHVPDGPGVLLVGHESNYSMDHTDGRWGLRFNRKAPQAGDNVYRLHFALAHAARACNMLEGALADSALKFSRQEFEIFINDRALAPNSPESFEACQPDILALLNRVLEDDQAQIRHLDDPRRLFRLAVKAGKPFDLVALSTSP